LGDGAPSHLPPSSANPAMVRVSRWAQVFLTQSLPRPDEYRLSRTLETTPSSPTLQAWRYISAPFMAFIGDRDTEVLLPIRGECMSDGRSEPLSEPAIFV
jgi:hypothetical protein